VLARTTTTTLLLGFLLFANARAQVPALGDIVPPSVTAGTLVTVPAMTPVYLRLGAEVSSKTSRPGDHFPISLAEDVRVGDAIVIPAGCTGEGEVVHAAKRSAGGKAGELILAARYLMVGDIQVHLRSFKAGGAGKDNTDSALAVAVFGGPFAMLVRGSDMVFPLDAMVSARTAEEIQLPAQRPVESSNHQGAANDGEKQDVPKTN
jgi:hypothetical protein